MRDIEARVLRAMLDKDTWSSMQDVVESKTFEGMVARRIFAIMGQLHDISSGSLTVGAVCGEIEATYHLKLDLRDELLDGMRGVGSAIVGDPATVKHTVTTLVQKAAALEAAQYVSIHVDQIDFDPSVPLMLFQKGADLAHALEVDVMEYRTSSAPGMDDRRGVVSLGLHSKIDRAFAGGLAFGEVVIYLAPSGRGKTSHMCWSATHGMKLGCNVLHITCEDHVSKVRQRYDSCLTGLDREGLLASPEVVMEKRATLPGNLYIQDWSSRNVRASDVRSLVMRLNASNRHVDYVVVDYLGKMTADAKMWDGARPFGKITAELRRVANELQFRCLTGWQATRGGFDVEILSEKDIADDIGVFRECDGMVGINQNKAQAKNYRATHNVMKSRDGTFRPSVIHHVDMDSMRFFDVATQAKEEPDVQQLDPE